MLTKVVISTPGSVSVGLRSIDREVLVHASTKETKPVSSLIPEQVDCLHSSATERVIFDDIKSDNLCLMKSCRGIGNEESSSMTSFETWETGMVVNCNL